GCAHDFAVLVYGILAGQHLQDDGARGHELAKGVVERLALVFLVELLRLGQRPADAFLGHDPQACVLDNGGNGTRQIPCCCIWFNNRKRLLDGHPSASLMPGFLYGLRRVIAAARRSSKVRDQKPPWTEAISAPIAIDEAGPKEPHWRHAGRPA